MGTRAWTTSTSPLMKNLENNAMLLTDKTNDLTLPPTYRNSRGGFSRRGWSRRHPKYGPQEWWLDLGHFLGLRIRWEWSLWARLDIHTRYWQLGRSSEGSAAWKRKFLSSPFSCCSNPGFCWWWLAEDPSRRISPDFVWMYLTSWWFRCIH